MKIFYEMQDLLKRFDIPRQTMYRWIEKYDIYYENTDTGRRIYTERTVEEIKRLLEIKGRS